MSWGNANRWERAEKQSSGWRVTLSQAELPGNKLEMEADVNKVKLSI